MSRKLFFFDFDSTLMDCETIDELAKAHGVMDEVSRITKEAMNGGVPFAEALRRRVAMLKGMEFTKAIEVMYNLPMMNGADELLKSLKKNGHMVVIVSGGFNVATHKVLYNYGLDGAHSNTLGVDENGLLSGLVSGPMMAPTAKGDMIKTYQDRFGISKADTIATGDGANDISMFEHADTKIAFCAKEILRKAANISITNKDLREILKELKIN
jgi:phosphoserine phosphatase